MRIGIDLGGTKIEGVVMAPDSSVITRQRVATPRDDYAATLAAIARLVTDLEAQAGRGVLSVGIGHPGTLSPASGLLKNSNSVCLNGQALQRDLEHLLSRPLRLANDANCLALSESVDGAAAGAASMFAVILGTGVGGGVVVDGQLLGGANGIAGEWGHNALPWPLADETPGPACWCGQRGCIETWLSGVGLAADHRRVSGEDWNGEAIVTRAAHREPAAMATMQRFEHRLARALAQVINLLDPDVIVLGGGVSRAQRLYQQVPALWRQWIFSGDVVTRLLPAQHGDASGVRGAARLWPLD